MYSTSKGESEHCEDVVDKFSLGLCASNGSPYATGPLSCLSCPYRWCIVAKRLNGSRCHLAQRYRPRPRRHYVRWGPSSRTERDTAVPLFSALVYCGQTAGWIRIPLGKEISLGSGDIVLDGDPSPPRKGAEQPLPHFSAHVCRGQTVAHLSNCWALVPDHNDKGMPKMGIQRVCEMCVYPI